jgi:hypothetical protein
MRNPVRGSRLPAVTDPKPTNEIPTIVLKGIAKIVLAVCGVPAGGEVVDLAAEIVLKYLANPNDRAAEAKFKQLQSGIESNVSVHPEKYKGSRPPSSLDVEQGLVRFATAYRKAGSHDKRWVLFNAFHNSFRPEFYNEGMAQILWPKVEALEYPDLRFLERVLFSMTDPVPQLDGFMPMAVIRKNHVAISNKDLEFEFARRLESQGLLVLEDALSKTGGYQGSLRSMGGSPGHGIVTGDSSVELRPTGIAQKLRDFALEEFWKNDIEFGANVGASE